MKEVAFRTPGDVAVPAITADEMRSVDRVAVTDVGLPIVQMMENAGRSLAAHARALRGADTDPVVVLAGAGGNGGGGLVCARHLANRNVPVTVVLDRDPDELSDASGTQLEVVRAMEAEVTTDAAPLADASLLVDALIGYGLDAAPQGRAKELIEAVGAADAAALSLDVPSGLDATTGRRPGVSVRPARTLTLALPKTGLAGLESELYLADIGIPATVYWRLDIPYGVPYDDAAWVRLHPTG